MVSNIWLFNQHNNFEVFQESNTAEAFNNTESDQNDLNNVIREATQNSLDARSAEARENGDPVIISITLGNSNKSMESLNFFDNFFIKPLADRIKGSQKFSHLPSCDFNPNFNYMVIEDENTTGLDGEDFPLCDGGGWKYFIWSEGFSEKKGPGNLGSWGMGKVTFLKNSIFRTVFVLSTYINENSERIERMSGLSEIGNHKLNGESWKGSGRYIRNEGDRARAVLDPLIIKSLRKFIKFKRNSNNPGLSVVVPFIDTNIINLKNIVVNVLKEYSPAISLGYIEYRIEDFSGKCEIINSDNINDMLNKYKDELDYSTIVKTLRIISHKSETKVFALKLDSINNLKESSLIKNHSDEIAKKLSNDEIVIINCELDILYNNKDSEVGSFVLGLSNSKKSKKAILLRNGLRISNAIDVQNYKLTGLIMVDGGPMADLVRNAENPSHTKLSANEEKFKKIGYKNGREILTILKKITLEFENILFSNNSFIDKSQVNKYFNFSNDRSSENNRDSSNNTKKSKHITTINQDGNKVKINVYNKVSKASKTKHNEVLITLNYEKNRNGGVASWVDDIDGKIKFGSGETIDPIIILKESNLSSNKVKIISSNSLILRPDFNDSIEFEISNIDTHRNILVESRDVL